jgi:hypothetical protein
MLICKLLNNLLLFGSLLIGFPLKVICVIFIIIFAAKITKTLIKNFPMKKIITLFALSIFGLMGIKSNAQCSLTDAPQFSNATNTSSFCQGSIIQFVVSAVVTDNSSNTFSYQWNTGGTYDTIVVPASGLLAGTYNYCCQVTDGISCSSYDCVTLTINANPVVTITSGPVCSGQVITLTANVTDASTNVISDYGWYPSASTSDTADIVITTNTTELSEVEDGNGCLSSVASINLVPNTPPVVTVTPLFDTICTGGQAYLTADINYNSTSSSSFSWTDGSTTSYDYASPISTQWETVTLTDGNGCRDTASALVTVDYITGNFTMNPNPVCIGSWSTVGLSLTTGLNLPLSYSWSTGGTNDTIEVSPATATTYTVQVADKYCSASGSSPILEVHGMPSVVISNPSPTCYLTPTTLTATVTDTASASFTYDWSNGSTKDTADVTPPINTIYTLVVMDGNGCTDTSLTLVQIWPLPNVTFPTIGFGSPICQGNTALTITGGLPGGGTYSGNNVSGGKFTPSTVGSNVILYTYTNNNHGCTDTASFDVIVTLCSDVNNISASSDFEVYPNPVSDNLYVKFDSKTLGTAATFTITDVTGRMVSETTSTVGGELIVPIDVSTLSSGMYFIKIVSENTTQTSKFVKE